MGRLQSGNRGIFEDLAIVDQAADARRVLVSHIAEMARPRRFGRASKASLFGGRKQHEKLALGVAGPRISNSLKRDVSFMGIFLVAKSLTFSGDRLSRAQRRHRHD
jgi:hypothetical protein